MSILDFAKAEKEYPISSVAKNEWLSFAMYTVESRAIPNMIDGLKPVQRFYLYSSILNSKNDFKKVSAVAGIYQTTDTTTVKQAQLVPVNLWLQSGTIMSA